MGGEERNSEEDMKKEVLMEKGERAKVLLAITGVLAGLMVMAVAGWSSTTVGTGSCLERDGKNTRAGSSWMYGSLRENLTLFHRVFRVYTSTSM